MVKRLLNALEYPQADTININDQTNFKKIIVWLETNKIRKATPNVLSNLNNVDSPNWDKIFEQYLKDLNCPLFGSNPEKLQWLLGIAVEIETSDKRDVYLKHAVSNIQITNTPNVITENPLDNLNFRSDEFSKKINEVAQRLKIQPHPDPLITLEAVSKVITKRLSKEAIDKPDNIIIRGTPLEYQDVDLGFDLGDPVLNKAAKVLRLLYIHDLRDLQTKANELTVAVQNITANPKTDTKLGKVGR